MTSVNIDGAVVRALREEKELTQLYLATVVGVTTDTISRWENRKYPSIKLENAEKLAQALEVPLEMILEQESNERLSNESDVTNKTSEPQETFAAPAGSRKGAEEIYRRRLFLVAGVLAVLAVAVGGLLMLQREPTVRAVRYLPGHTAPNLPFPVIIRLNADQEITVPILLREVIEGKAEAGAEDQPFGKNPRWIGRLVDGEAAFLYMVFPQQELKEGEDIRFSGECVSGKLKKTGTGIEGSDRISISNHHWADGDRDFTITDEEILNAYERYSFPGSREVDFSELERLWLAGKYRWEEQQRMFVPE